MNLTQIQKSKVKTKRRLGQGHGSGRGKTGGRGTKGLKARGRVKLSFEGGALPLIKRLPFMRGKGRNASLQHTDIVINVGVLNALPKDSVVSKETLIKYHIIKPTTDKRTGIKILGDGELTVALNVKLPVSKGAAEKVKKAGGSVE